MSIPPRLVRDVYDRYQVARAVAEVLDHNLATRRPPPRWRPLRLLAWALVALVSLGGWVGLYVAWRVAPVAHWGMLP